MQKWGASWKAGEAVVLARPGGAGGFAHCRSDDEHGQPCEMGAQVLGES
jgi:hypothetical protein